MRDGKENIQWLVVETINEASKHSMVPGGHDRRRVYGDCESLEVSMVTEWYWLGALILGDVAAVVVVIGGFVYVMIKLIEIL